MNRFVVLPAIGFLVLGVAAAAITAVATSGKSEQTIQIDRTVVFTDRTGPHSFSLFLNFTPAPQERIIKVYYTFNTSVEQEDAGTGGTMLVTDLLANGELAQGLEDIIPEPQSHYDRRILRTEHLKVPSGTPFNVRVDVSNQPLPGPQADWAIRYHAMDWRLELEVEPLWPLVLAFAVAGAAGAVAWLWWMNRRPAAPVP
jgi:hypothetical protein